MKTRLLFCLIIFAAFGFKNAAAAPLVKGGLSNNAYLTTLTCSAGTLTPTSVVAFKITVSYATTSLTVTPTAADVNATIAVNGTVVASGTPSQSISLSVGTNVVSIPVTAQDGVTIRNYYVVVTRQGPSNNAYLATLTASSGPLTQTSLVDFKTTVSYSTTSITVTPTTGDPNATVSVNGSPVISGTASQNIALSVGTNVVSVPVTAQDGVTIKNYYIVVTRQGPSNDAYLSTLTSSSGALSQSGILTFYATVSYGTTSLTLTPTAGDPNATIVVNGLPVVSGNPSQSISLNVGINIIYMPITAQDGVTVNNYVITITRASSTVNYTWAGTTNTLWSVATNWAPNGHPGSGDGVQIPTTSNPPTVDLASTCQSITVTGSTSITLSAPLTVNTGITVNAPLTISGTDVATTGSLTIDAGGSLTNTATVTVNNGDTFLDAGTSINNQAGGTFNSTGAFSINMLANAVIANAGTFNVDDETINIGASGYISNAAGGVFTVNDGSTIDFANNSATNGYISNRGIFYAGTSNSMCTLNLDYTGNYIQNSSLFYLGSTSVINLTGTSVSLQNTGTFTLQSDITGSATIGNITGSGATCTGLYTVERYISGGTVDYRSYRLLSSPVNAGTVGGNTVYSINYVQATSFITGTTGTAGGFDKSGNPTLYLFRDNLPVSNASFISGNFRGVSNISTSPSYAINGDGSGFTIPVGNGFLFFFRGDRVNNVANKYSPGTVAESVTMAATGALNTGQITVKPWFNPTSSNLDYTEVPGNSSVVGFALVGNPYASSIDWDTMDSVSVSTDPIYVSGVTKFMYILDPVSRNYNVYGAKLFGFGTIAYNNSNIIASGQGFFVQATNTSAQMVFNESAKTNTQVSTSDQNLFLGKPAQATITQYMHLKLAKDSINTDGIFIAFKSDAKPQFDATVDARYKVGNGTVSLSSRSADSVTLAVNTLALPKQKQVKIGLNVSAQADGLYNLSLTAIKSVPELYEVWLMDAYKKDSLDIKHNPTYAFDILKSDAASFGANRFSLVIRQNPALGVHLLNFTAVKATASTQITWKTENEVNYTNFTVQRSNDGGVTFDVVGGFPSNSLGAYSTVDKTPQPGANLYRLKLEDLNGTITYSNVVTLMYGNTGNTISKNNIDVYPNPAVNTINLSIPASTKPSQYDIQIVNNTGAIISSATSAQSTWQSDISKLLPGTYIIKVVNTTDSSVVGKSTFIKL